MNTTKITDEHFFSRIALVGFLGIAVFFLWTEHRAHLLGALPYLLLILGGFVFLSSTWRVLYAAQREGRLATTGAYAVVRHPQYIAFVVIMFGFLLQWPTLLTVLMFPVLVLMYGHLAREEEREVHEAFGKEWKVYAAKTPAFIPHLRSLSFRGEHAEIRKA